MKHLLLSILIGSLFFNCQANQEQSTVESSISAELKETNAEVESKELQAAPNFTLMNIDGKQQSLEDFKGKYVFLDIWATWCGPCRVQIPAMKTLAAKYPHLTFLSISIDADQDHSKWEQMVREEQMSGVHLFAGQSSGFAEAYQVDFIPRFILLTPEGKIIMDPLPQPFDANTGGVNPALIQVLDMIP